MGERGEEGAGPLRRVVGAAVVHDDELGRLGVDGAGRDGDAKAGHAVVEPRPLVVGRDHQGERHPGGRGRVRPRPGPPSVHAPILHRRSAFERVGSRDPDPTLGTTCPDEAVGEDGGVRDRGAGEGGLNDRIGAVGTGSDVHDHVVDRVVGVQVVIEEQVTGFERVE